MTELLLHHIWEYKLFTSNAFTGHHSESIELLNPGFRNPDAGPDFFNARIRVDGITLAGNIEIHTRSSDWLRHGHQHNKAYDNLILHVVYEHDTPLPQNERNHVPVLELKPYIAPATLEQYSRLQGSRNHIPCGRSIGHVPSFIWEAWLQRLAVSRLEEKVQYIEQAFKYTKNDFEEALYITLCRNFGFKTNSSPFELLARRLPFRLLRKHADDPQAIEALLFGTAGMLDDVFDEAYPRLLQNRYEFLKHKYSLVPMPRELWKFMRLRPGNFPSLRMAQLAALFSKSESLFHLAEQLPDAGAWYRFFEVQLPAYWNTHYRFDAASEAHAKSIGNDSVRILIINTIVPYLFFLSRHHQSEQFSDHALALLMQLEPETNSKTKPFADLDRKPASALESQAMIQLYDRFCSTRRCLDCNVAGFLLKSSLKSSAAS